MMIRFNRKYVNRRFSKPLATREAKIDPISTHGMSKLFLMSINFFYPLEPDVEFYTGFSIGNILLV